MLLAFNLKNLRLLCQETQNTETQKLGLFLKNQLVKKKKLCYVMKHLLKVTKSTDNEFY